MFFYIDGWLEYTGGFTFSSGQYFSRFSVLSGVMLLDDIRIYDCELTFTQISAFIDPTKYLQLYYSFDTWTSVLDSIVQNEGSLGSSNDGVMSNATIVSSDFAVGSQCLMIGTLSSESNAACMTVAGTIDLSKKHFTVCFWLKSPTSAWIPGSRLFVLSDGTSSFEAFWDENDTMCVTMNNTVYTTVRITSDNEWHHYAFVNDTAQRKCFFYSDGVLNFGIDSYSYSDFVCDSCRIGRSEESSNTGPYLFDDFRVYTTALKSLYIQTLARMYSNPGKRIPYLH